MAKFDEEKFNKNLNKKINKKLKLKSKKYGNIKIGSRNSNGFYFLGFLGSAIYFIGHSNGFWDGVLGFLKAIIWPLFLVYEAFSKLLG